MEIEVAIPKLGLTMTEALLVRWLVEDGQQVTKGQPIFEIETDKATFEAEAAADGILHISIEAGIVMPVMGRIGYIHALDREPAAGPQRLMASPAARRRARELEIDIEQVKGTGENGRITIADVERYAVAVTDKASNPSEERRASPLAKRIAREAGIELATVQGSGAGGRITKQDVESAILEKQPSAPVSTEIPSPPGGLIPFSNVRSIIAKRMLTSSQDTASVTITCTVDATELVSMRAQLNEGLSDKLGFSISYNDILIRIVAKSLREFPYMNAHREKDAIRLIPEVHIGLAVDTQRGLLVVVVREADRKSILEISRDAQDKVQRTIDGKTAPDELSGGTFTITNLGALGVEAFTPIINPPEVGILGIGQIAQEPMAYRGEICLRYRMVLSLTFDHSLVDGAPAARFLGRVKDLIEKPYLMMVDDVS
jgi:pyruvate dehydrogenase E2 component (dihydrolipoamide acetyltransferase)